MTVQKSTTYWGHAITMVYQSEAFQNSPHDSVVFVECSAKFISLLSFLNVKTFINLQLNSFHLSTCYRKWAWNPKEWTNIIPLLVWKYHVEMSNYQNTLTLVYCTIKLGQCVNKSILSWMLRNLCHYIGYGKYLFFCE